MNNSPTLNIDATEVEETVSAALDNLSHTTYTDYVQVDVDTVRFTVEADTRVASRIVLITLAQVVALQFSGYDATIATAGPYDVEVTLRTSIYEEG